MSGVSETSLLAYYNKIAPNVQPKELEVMKVLMGGAYTNKEIAVRLNWDPGTVSGRTNSLEEKGLIFESDKRQCRVTKNTAKEWKLTEKGEAKVQQFLRPTLF